MFGMNNKKGLILMLTCALLLSLGGVCVKQIPWNPLSINGFHSIISVCILFGFAKLTRNRFQLTPGVLVGMVGVCGATVLYTVATKLTTAGSAVLLQFTVAPVFILLFTWLVFHERPKGLDVIACLCIVGGVLCFFLDSLGSGRLVGDAVAVLSGVSYALVFLTNKLPGGNALWATILGQSIGALIGLPSLVQETQFDRGTLFYAIVLGVFQLGLAYVCLTTGVKYVKPVTAILVTGIEPVLNPILVAVVVGETLSPLSLLGGAIVFVSVMVYNILSARGERPRPQPKPAAKPA